MKQKARTRQQTFQGHDSKQVLLQISPQHLGRPTHNSELRPRLAQKSQRSRVQTLQATSAQLRGQATTGRRSGSLLMVQLDYIIDMHLSMICDLSILLFDTSFYIP